MDGVQRKVTLHSKEGRQTTKDNDKSQQFRDERGRLGGLPIQ